MTKSYLTYNTAQHFGLIHSIFFFLKQPHLWFNGQFILRTNTADEQNTDKKRQESRVGLNHSTDFEMSCLICFTFSIPVVQRGLFVITTRTFHQSIKLYMNNCSSLAKVDLQLGPYILAH